MADMRGLLLLACHISAEQEEPWRRLLQELAPSVRKEEYARSRRRLGVSAESLWLVPTKLRRGGVAVACLQADNPGRVLRELAAPDAPFDSWYGKQMRKAFGFDVARIPRARAASGELLFAWRDDDARDEREASKSP